jgi:hypothetical protein
MTRQIGLFRGRALVELTQDEIRKLVHDGGQVEVVGRLGRAKGR